jgi:hypothetical protein
MARGKGTGRKKQSAKDKEMTKKTLVGQSPKSMGKITSMRNLDVG